MTPLLRRIYVMRRRKKIKALLVINARGREEARAIEDACRFRASHIKTWLDEVRYREDFRIMADHS